MIDMYCKLIIHKRRSFDRVPESLKDDVELRLAELGYNKNGDPVEN